jgi:hypothetical protein
LSPCVMLSFRAAVFVRLPLWIWRPSQRYTGSNTIDDRQRTTFTTMFHITYTAKLCTCLRTCSSGVSVLLEKCAASPMCSDIDCDKHTDRGPSFYPSYWAAIKSLADER